MYLFGVRHILSLYLVSAKNLHFAASLHSTLSEFLYRLDIKVPALVTHLVIRMIYRPLESESVDADYLKMQDICRLIYYLGLNITPTAWVKPEFGTIKIIVIDFQPKQMQQTFKYNVWFILKTINTLKITFQYRLKLWQCFYCGSRVHCKTFNLVVL